MRARVAFPLHLLSSSIAWSLEKPAETISWIDTSGNDCWTCCRGRDWRAGLSDPPVWDGEEEGNGREMDGDSVVA